jgi:predicted ATPase/DNA-binding SARP family transcriptional activator
VAGDLAIFRVLGSLELEREGEVVAVPSGRQGSLLALLLFARGVPLSRDHLIDELWGEQPPVSAVSALHVHLSKLRDLIGGMLVLEPAGYVLTPGAFEVDAWRLDSLLAAARANPEDAGALSREALALFRGEPLANVAAEGSIAQWRRALEEKRLQVIALRIDADLEAGQAAELIPELEQLVSRHPLEERLWGQLMLALYRAGRQAEALDAYQRVRRLLSGDLGLDPGEQLTGLQQRILDQDPTLLVAARTPVRPVPPASSLPRPLTRLVGREQEVLVLAEMMADPEVRVVTLTGSGGVGKTRLLVEMARRLEDGHADGALFVRLEQVTDPALVGAEIARALARGDASGGPTADGLAAYLSEREMLLAVDNFEHVIPAATLISELLEAAPRLRVMISSRRALRIRGENVFEVEPLGLPTDESETELSQSPAVQLFAQCAQAANRRLALDEPSIFRAFGAICRALDGLPLAIELAASRMGLVTTRQIEAQLTVPLWIGDHGLRDLPDRQQTLEATISWSYDLLTPGAQSALRGAGAFLGGFSPGALAAVSNEAGPAQLDELLEAHLIRRQGDSDRFELLELVRAFALHRLQESGELADSLARHRAYFGELIAPLSEAFDGGQGPGELAAPFLVDHPNVRAALESALAAGDEETTLALALGLRPLWLAGMLFQEAQESVGRILDRFQVPPEKEIGLLRAVAFLDGFSARPPVWNRRLAARAAEFGDHEAFATATGNLFAHAINARDLDEMKRLRPSMLALITPESNARVRGWTHYFLALDAYVHGQIDSACDHAAQSVDQAEEIGHEYMLASAVGTRMLAVTARDSVMVCGALADAIECMRRPSIAPLSAFALWLVARFAAGVDPAMAGRWLAHSERILAASDSEIWPESILREETMAVLGISDLDALLSSTPPLEHAEALAAASDWLAGRDREEQAPRATATAFVSASGGSPRRPGAA